MLILATDLRGKWWFSSWGNYPIHIRVYQWEISRIQQIGGTLVPYFWPYFGGISPYMEYIRRFSSQRPEMVPESWWCNKTRFDDSYDSLLCGEKPWRLVVLQIQSLDHGSLNVPIEHHPTIRYMVYNGYYKVMSNIPKMGQLPTPVDTVWIPKVSDLGF